MGACGGGSAYGDSATTAAGSATTVPRTSSVATTAAPTNTTATATTPAATPTAAATTSGATPNSDIAAAVIAATSRFKAMARAKDVSCADGNPGQQPCIAIPGPGDPEGPDIIRLTIAFPGEGGAALFYAHDQSGAWDLWFASQQIPYELVALPGDMLVCADGDGVNVRASPAASATVVKLLPDLTPMHAEAFVLTHAADTKFLGGQGWYRISAPVAGWVRSDFATDAALESCDARNQTLSSR